MKFVFTKHVKKRIKSFNIQGLRITQKEVIRVISNSEHVDKESDSPKIIASRSMDSKHILRVVFKIEDDIITIITCYPAKKGRYYET